MSDGRAAETPVDEKIKELERQIEALQEQWPAHSVPPAMLERLDDLEEELAAAKAVAAALAAGRGSGEEE